MVEVKTRPFAWLVASALTLAGCFPDWVPPKEDTQGLDEDTVTVDTIVRDTEEAQDTSVIAPDTEEAQDTSVIVPDTAVATTDTVAHDAGTDGEGGDTSAPECTPTSGCGDLDVPPCVVGRCVEGVCTASVVTGPCDDGDPCTTEDACTATGCTGRPWTQAEFLGWEAVFDGPGRDIASSVTTHPSGDVTVVGAFEQTADLGGVSRSARGDATRADAYIARFDKAGHLKWVAQAGGPLLDFALDVAAVGEAAVVIGWFEGTAQFGAGESPVSLASWETEGQSFIAKYSSNGDLGFVQRLPGAAHRVVALPDGSVAVSGAFRDHAAFVPAGVDEIAFPAVGGIDLYLARVSASGLTLWAGRLASSWDDMLWTPVLGVSGAEIIDAQWMKGTSTYTLDTVSYGLGVPASGGQVITRFNSSGVPGGSIVLDFDEVNIITDIAGYGGATYLGGFSGAADAAEGAVRLFVAKRVGATMAWDRLLAGDGQATIDTPYPTLVVPFGAGVAMIGGFAGTLTFSDAPLSPAVTSQSDALEHFIAVYDAAGEPVRAMSWPLSPMSVMDDFAYKSSLGPRGVPIVPLAIPSMRGHPGGGLALAATTTGSPAFPSPPFSVLQGLAAAGGAGVVALLPPAVLAACPVP